MIISLIRLMRPPQWLKNFLVFAPLIAAHAWQDPNRLVACFWAFVIFSLTASSLYIFNDLSDLNSDSQMKSKSHRPLVTGKVSVPVAIVSSFVLLMIATWGALQLGRSFSTAISIYILVTIIYTIFLKKIALLDIFTLAILLTVRIFAGAAVANIIVSDWLIAFSLFFFLSLAISKRTSELIETSASNLKGIPGRGYSEVDKLGLVSMGFASAFASAIILSLYIKSAEVRNLYSHPDRLWFLALLFLFWLCSLWRDCLRGQINGDPVAYAAKKPYSYVILILILLTIYWAL